MKNDINPVAKIFLVSPGGRGSPFCGPGMIHLLDEINETGNVRKACENMSMSYSKGWKLLSGLESWLEYPVTVRQQGGKGGGKAHLTDEGKEFLKRHRNFEADCEAAVQGLFEKYYRNTDALN